MSATPEADLAGWLAAALTFATFASRDMARLRVLAVLANLAFIAYGFHAALWPVLALHLALLPVNLHRLLEQRRLQAQRQHERPQRCAGSGDAPPAVAPPQPLSR